MARPHKYHHSRIEIETTLPPDQVADIVCNVIDMQKPLQLSKRDDHSISVIVKSFVGVSLMSFRVVLTSNAAGRTRAVSEMTEYTTSQRTYFFIPIAPRFIDGYSEYRRFMRSFKQVVEGSDPTAQCTIIEQEILR